MYILFAPALIAVLVIVGINLSTLNPFTRQQWADIGLVLGTACLLLAFYRFVL